MADQITHHAFFGDRERAFCLTDAMVAELERLTGSGIGTLFMQIARNQFHLETLIEAIRLGLIGAGESPATAARLVETYARHRPIGEVYPLALDILDARWSGVEPATEAAAQKVAA